jgi:hypothetical protein
MEAEPPELDAACVSRVLSFVDDAATMGAALRVSRLWRRCGRDATLPMWAEMDAARFRALHLGAAEPRFCACAVVHSLRRGAGRTLRRLDLSAATSCDTCRINLTARGFTVVVRPVRRRVAAALVLTCTAGAGERSAHRPRVQHLCGAVHAWESARCAPQRALSLVVLAPLTA